MPFPHGSPSGVLQVILLAALTGLAAACGGASGSTTDIGDLTCGAPRRVSKPDVTWRAQNGRHCIGTGPYAQFCDGPRRVPEPHGEAADLAKQLGLGEHATVDKLFSRAPDPKWVAAVQGRKPDSLLWPVPEKVMFRGFGYVRKTIKDKRHDGVDIPATPGTPILAVADALVAYADNGVHGFGNFLVLIHADATVTVHAHCNAIYVFPGQRVRQGQIVAEVGNTGISRGPHLHFEWRVNGEPKDPAPRFACMPSRPSSTPSALARAD